MKSIKRILLVAMMILSTAAMANAQFKWGIKAGLNVNKLHFTNDFVDKTFDSGNSTGWEAGLMAEFTVPVIGIGFDASVMYARMNNGAGNEVIIPEENGNETAAKVLGQNFLEIPINIKYKFTLPVVSSFLKPMIYTGPTFAFKLDKNVFDSMKTKSCQVAWNVGIGLEFLNHLQIAAGYNFGMNNVFDKVGIVNAEKIKAKNNYWTVTAAYLF